MIGEISAAADRSSTSKPEIFVDLPFGPTLSAKLVFVDHDSNLSDRYESKNPDSRAYDRAQSYSDE